MSLYNRGLRVGAVAPTDTSFDKLRKEARKEADGSKTRFTGVAFTKNGKEVFSGDDESKAADWYGAIVDKPDVFYVAWYDNKQLYNEFLGEIQVSTKPPGIPGWMWGVMAATVGVAFVAGKKRGG